MFLVSRVQVLETVLLSAWAVCAVATILLLIISSWPNEIIMASTAITHMGIVQIRSDYPRAYLRRCLDKLPSNGLRPLMQLCAGYRVRYGFDFKLILYVGFKAREIIRRRIESLTPQVAIVEFENLLNESSVMRSGELLQLVVFELRTALLNLRLNQESIQLSQKGSWPMLLKDSVQGGLSLRGAFLAGADCSRLALQNVDLSEADLRGTAWNGASLQTCNFSCADLRYAEFSGCRMDSATARSMQQSQAHSLPDPSRSQDFRNGESRADEVEAGLIKLFSPARYATRTRWMQVVDYPWGLLTNLCTAALLTATLFLAWSGSR